MRDLSIIKSLEACVTKPSAATVLTWQYGVLCQKQVSKAGISNYTPQYLLDHGGREPTGAHVWSGRFVLSLSKQSDIW